MKISKMFKFSAAHRLTHVAVTHPCYSLHGHNYKAKVSIFYEIAPGETMVMDYRDMSLLLDPYFDGYDHAVLVSQTDRHLSEMVSSPYAGTVFKKVKSLPVKSTTCELLAIYMVCDIEALIKRAGFFLETRPFNVSLKLSESDTSSVTVLASEYTDFVKEYLAGLND